MAGWVYHLQKCGCCYQSKKIKPNSKDKCGKGNRITNWGEAANGYLQSIRKNLSNRKRFENVVNKAKSIAKKNKRKDITVCTSFDQNKDECGLLRDNTDSDD